MRRNLLTLTLMAALGFAAGAQTRYFEFGVVCGHGNWQDTSFIAATSDPVLIDSVLANIARPFEQRNFINGNITHGDGGHNRNADHWFLWHFIPGEWNLTELAFEVCDGCPYTDVDLDTAYWIGTLGYFCPWSGKPVREVTDPALSIKTAHPFAALLVYPNPAKDVLHLQWNASRPLRVLLLNAMGQVVSAQALTETHPSVQMGGLSKGVYFLLYTDGQNTGMQKVVVSGE